MAAPGQPETERELTTAPMLRRRDFIALLGATVTGLSDDGMAQQSDRVRRIGALWFGGDPQYGRAFYDGLRDLGWVNGQNIRVEARNAGGEANRLRALAIELVSSSPEVIVANSPLEARALQQQTRTIPIVFVVAVDPISHRLMGTPKRTGAGRRSRLAGRIGKICS